MYSMVYMFTDYNYDCIQIDGLFTLTQRESRSFILLLIIAELRVMYLGCDGEKTRVFQLLVLCLVFSSIKASILFSPGACFIFLFLTVPRLTADWLFLALLTILASMRMVPLFLFSSCVGRSTLLLLPPLNFLTPPLCNFNNAE